MNKTFNLLAFYEIRLRIRYLLDFVWFFGVFFILNWLPSPLVSGAKVECESDCFIFCGGGFEGPGVWPAFRRTISLRKYEDREERLSLYCLLSG